MEIEGAGTATVVFETGNGYPATARRLRAVRIPASLPIIDIVAEHSWAETPESATAMREAHARFVAQSRSRESVFAAGSTHNGHA